MCINRCVTHKECIFILQYLSWINNHVLCFALAINLLDLCLTPQVYEAKPFLRHMSELVEKSYEDTVREKFCLWDLCITAVAIFPVNLVFCHCSATWYWNSWNHQMWFSHYWQHGTIETVCRSYQRDCKVIISECVPSYL